MKATMGVIRLKDKKFHIENYLNPASQPKQENNTGASVQIQYISVYDLQPNPNNFYQVSDIEHLAAMIEMQGSVVTPLEVKAIDNEKYMIIAGHRRRAAVLYLLEHGSTVVTSSKVPAIIRDYENDEAETMSLIFSNRGQRTRTADEITEEINRLRPIARRIYEEEKAKGNVSGRFRKFFAEEILQISEASLQRKTQLAHLSSEVKEELDKGTLTITAASELARLKPEQQNKILCQVKEKEGPVTVKTIQKEKGSVKQLVPDNADSDRDSENEAQEQSLEQNDAFLMDLETAKKVLLQYEQEITIALANTVSHIDSYIQNRTKVDITQDLSHLQELFTHMSAEIDQLQQR